MCGEPLLAAFGDNIKVSAFNNIVLIIIITSHKLAFGRLGQGGSLRWYWYWYWYWERFIKKNFSAVDAITKYVTDGTLVFCCSE